MSGSDSGKQLTILRRKEVEKRTGLSRSTIYAKLKFDPKRPSLYDPTFPRPIKLGASASGNSAVGWIEHEVDAWIIAQVQQRDAVGGHHAEQ